MFFPKFPSTTLQDVNLDWILKKIRALRGGTTNQVLAKASNADFDFKWITGSGGGGTSDYNDLVNQPQINDVTLQGNLSASELGLLDSSALASYRTAAAQDTIDSTKQPKIAASGMLKGDGDGGVTAATLGVDYLAPAALMPYRTASDQNIIDAAQNTQISARAKADEIAVLITGSRPSMAVSAGQYVVVRDSTISGINAGLYIAVNALSPSTDVTAADLSAVNNGGLNGIPKWNYAVSTVMRNLTIAPYSYVDVVLTDIDLPSSFNFVVHGDFGNGQFLRNSWIDNGRIKITIGNFLANSEVVPDWAHVKVLYQAT